MNNTRQLTSDEVRILLHKARIHQINGEIERMENIIKRIREQGDEQATLELAELKIA